jgi:hypothetical protein
MFFNPATSVHYNENCEARALKNIGYALAVAEISTSSILAAC